MLHLWLLIYSVQIHLKIIGNLSWVSPANNYKFKKTLHPFQYYFRGCFSFVKKHTYIFDQIANA